MSLPKKPTKYMHPILTATIVHHAPAIVAILALLASSVFCMTMTPPSPVIVGESTTIVWGSAPGGVDVAPVVMGATVVSIRWTPRNGGPVGEIENPDGAIIESILLDDGGPFEVETVLDTALTYPTQGDAVTVVLPVAIDLSGNAPHTTFPCLLLSNPFELTRKAPGRITFRLDHAPGRDGVATS